jgi:hypothetical protein
MPGSQMAANRTEKRFALHVTAGRDGLDMKCARRGIEHIGGGAADRSSHAENDEAARLGGGPARLCLNSGQHEPGLPAEKTCRNEWILP